VIHRTWSIRLSESMRNQLAAAAEEQQRSLAAEIRYRLKQSFEIEDAGACASQRGRRLETKPGRLWAGGRAERLSPEERRPLCGGLSNAVTHGCANDPGTGPGRRLVHHVAGWRAERIQDECRGLGLGR